jgi:hypothetical protein
LGEWNHLFFFTYEIRNESRQNEIQPN